MAKSKYPKDAEYEYFEASNVGVDKFWADVESRGEHGWVLFQIIPKSFREDFNTTGWYHAIYRRKLS